jgi:hypothetical protein
MEHSKPVFLYGPEYALKMLSITLLRMLASTLPITLDDTLAAYVTMHCQVSSHDAINRTPKHVL